MNNQRYNALMKSLTKASRVNTDDSVEVIFRHRFRFLLYSGMYLSGIDLETGYFGLIIHSRS